MGMEVKVRKAKIWEIILGSCSNATGVTFYMLMMQASYAASNNFGVAISAVSVFMMAARIFDGVTDGLFGGLFDKFNPTKGKIRIFILIGWVVECLAALAMYDWLAGRFDGILGFVIFIIAYFAYLIGYTLMNIGGGCIGVTLTKDPVQRPLMSVVSTLFSYFIPLILSNVQSFIILPKYDNKFNSAMLSELAWWYVGISAVFVLLTMIGLKDADVRENFSTGKKEEKVSFKDMWNALKGNRNLQMFIVTTATDKLAQQTAGVSYINVMLGGILIGSYQANQMIGNFSQIISYVFLFIGFASVAKLGARKATTVWSWLSIAVTAITIGLCVIIFIGHGDLKLVGVFGPAMIIYAICQLGKQGSGMVLTIASTTMMADVSDAWYDESGKYLPGVISGVKSFLDKLISSFSTVIAGFAVMAVGYRGTHVPQEGDPVTSGIFWLTMALAFGLPILGWICNVISMHFYNLTKERMAEVQKNVAEKKAQAQA